MINYSEEFASAYDELQKAIRDRSHLTQKVITDKNGHTRKVWVKTEVKTSVKINKNTEDSKVSEFHVNGIPNKKIIKADFKGNDIDTLEKQAENSILDVGNGLYVTVVKDKEQQKKINSIMAEKRNKVWKTLENLEPKIESGLSFDYIPAPINTGTVYVFDKKGNIKGDNVFGGALSDIGCVEGGDDYGMYGNGLHEATNTKYFNTDGLGKNTEERFKPGTVLYSDFINKPHINTQYGYRTDKISENKIRVRNADGFDKTYTLEKVDDKSYKIM